MLLKGHVRGRLNILESKVWLLPHSTLSNWGSESHWADSGLTILSELSKTDQWWSHLSAAIFHNTIPVMWAWSVEYFCNFWIAVLLSRDKLMLLHLGILSWLGSKFGFSNLTRRRKIHWTQALKIEKFRFGCDFLEAKVTSRSRIVAPCQMIVSFGVFGSEV